MTAPNEHRDTRDERRVRLDSGRLLVGGRRRIVLGAEIHNSNSSSVEAIELSFARVKDLGADCVLAPVSWNQFEPREGGYDSTLVDAMVGVAMRLDIDIIPLWFGSWKNGMSSYVPGWLKTDRRRFPRAMHAGGAVEVLSPFSSAARDADASAFAALMRRLREIDTDGRVLMVQVENEVGLLGGARDLSEAALLEWREAVPSIVVEAVRGAPGTRAHGAWQERGGATSGAWSDLFGDAVAGEEAFMAAGYARYVERVAASGRAEFDVPTFVNAWQDADLDPVDVDTDVAVAGGQQPGSYPSGGPVRDVIGIWRACAPTIDFCAPDIYSPNFSEIAAGYRERSGTLFIPEMQRGPQAIGDMFVAIGEHGAVGVSPFGADSFLDDGAAGALRDGYGILGGIASILADDPDAETGAVHLSLARPEASIRINGLELSVTILDPYGSAPPDYRAFAIVVEEADGRVVVGGRGCSVAAVSWHGGAVGILSATELRHAAGRWVAVRELNGDETAGGAAVRLPPFEPLPMPGAIPLWHEFTGLVRIEYYPVS